MCEGGRLLADFTAGTSFRPDVPAEVERALVPTSDGRWLVWAHKVARPVAGGFLPLNRRGGCYSTAARAECWRQGAHDAPDAGCTCGFHAVSSPRGLRPLSIMVRHIGHLEVALSGRVLAFEWSGGGALFRAAEQVVLKVHAVSALGAERRPDPPERPDDDPGGARRRPVVPRGSGPVALDLPRLELRPVVVDDDAGWCVPQAPEFELTHDEPRPQRDLLRAPA